MESKTIIVFSLILFLGMMMTKLVSATEFSAFTLSIVDLTKVFIALMGLIIIVMAVFAFFAGGPSFIRLIVIMGYVGIAVLIILIFVPILINYISTTIG